MSRNGRLLFTPSYRLEPLTEKWRRFARADLQEKAELSGRFFLKFVALLLGRILWLIVGSRSVRIGVLSAKGRITLMISYIESFMRQAEVEAQLEDSIVIVINPGRSPNPQLSKMYKRALWLLDDSRPGLRIVFRGLYRLFSAAGSRLAVTLFDGFDHRYAKAWQQGTPVLKFTDQEKRMGERLLQTLGIPRQSPYVCFGVRNAAYYQQFLRPEAQARHPNPEAGLDTYIRNPPLGNYLPMTVECARQGLYVTHMGEVVEELLPSGMDKRVIDYASRHRTPFGDIYLLAHCKFAVAGAAGLWLIASAFNRPVVLTDAYHLRFRMLRKEDLFISKKIWMISEKRFLTFREMLQIHDRYTFQSNCRRDGVELIHNTSDEICAVVREMNERLDGTWQTSKEDEELQRRFDSLYQPEYMGYRMPGRIGAEFLRQHSDLL